MFFARVLFHGEHVSQINPLYVHVLGRKTDSDCEFLGWQTNKRSQLPHTVLAVRLLTAAPSSLVSAVHQVKIQKKKARWGFCQFMKKNNNCSLFCSEIKILNSVPLTHRVVCNDKLFYSMTEESFQTKQSNTDWLFLFQWDEKINLHQYTECIITQGSPEAFFVELSLSFLQDGRLLQFAEM